MIMFRDVTLRRGQHVLLEHVDWTIYHKQRIGLIGANGSGKTSLFALFLQKIQLDHGELDIPRHVQFAHVAQETLSCDDTALAFVLDGDHELRQLQSALAEAENSHDGERIAILHEKIDIIDGYTANTRAAIILSGLGFQHDEQQKKVSEFSGGWRVRLNLAQALMCRSNVLLLDEPTNHLDLDAVLWLEEWLNKYQGTLILISHDRDFLDQTVDHIAHISHQQLKVYTGNYSAFEKQRANDLLVQQAAYEKQQKVLTHMQSFVDRFRYKASKARQAQSRLKAIERMDLVCAVQMESPFQFRFKLAAESPNPLLQLEKVRAGYSDKIILHSINLTITPRDRIAILGPNGAGKSTLIKLLAGELIPMNGVREAASGLKIGYFAQHQVDQLHLTDSPLDHLRRLAQKESDLELRKFLGGFDFSGDRILQPVQYFSGGEKSRLALALLVWQKPNLLLLDEPTNHLDLEMRNALSIALQEYEGAMLLVSHDRFLVRTTTDQLMLVANGRLELFDGDLTDYQHWLFEFRKKQMNGEAFDDERILSSRKEQRRQNARARELERPLLKKIKQLEDELVQLEKEMNTIEIALTDLSLYEAQNKTKLQKLLLSQAQLKSQIEQVENAWLQACEERSS